MECGVHTGDGYTEAGVFYNNQNPFCAYTRLGTTYGVLRWDLPFDSYKILEEE